MNNLEDFLIIYMYFLEEKLNLQKQDKLRNIKFKSGKQNLDSPLIQRIMEIIEKDNFYSLDTLIEKPINKIKNLQVGNKTKTISLVDFKGWNVQILLGDKKNYSNKQDKGKKWDGHFKSANADFFVPPDLGFIITDAQGNTYYKRVEIKMTKAEGKGKIPGSSIQQLSENEWLIFFKYSLESKSKDASSKSEIGNIIDVTIGYYTDAINWKQDRETNKIIVPFPDRSPRPIVSFSRLKKWNEQNRIAIGDTIHYKKNQNKTFQNDENIIKDWKWNLIDRWIEIVLNPEKTNYTSKDKWFDVVLKEFIISFLQKYNNLTNDEKEEVERRLKENLNNK